MKNTALLAPLALLLALAAGTSRPAASVTSFQTLDAPVAVLLQDDAQERATLGAGEVSSQLIFCQYCLTDCPEPNCCFFEGQACSWQGSGCSCQFCGGEFDCFAHP